MSSLQFNEAPSETNDRVANEPDKTTNKTNDKTTASTMKDKGPNTPRVRWFHYDSSLAQAMAVTPGTQDTDTGLAPEASNKNEASTMGKDIGGTGIINKDYNVNMVTEGKGPFQKLCLGISSKVEKIAVRVAMEIFTAVFEKDEDLLPDMHIQVCSEQLAPFPLLAVTADNHIMVIHGIH